MGKCHLTVSNNEDILLYRKKKKEERHYDPKATVPPTHYKEEVFSRQLKCH